MLKGKGAWVVLIVMFFTIPLALTLQLGLLNALIFAVPVIASWFLFADPKKSLNLPIYQILAIISLALGLASISGILCNASGVLLTMLMILLSGLGLAPLEDDGVARSLALSSIYGGLITSIAMFSIVLSGFRDLVVIIPIFTVASSLLALYRCKTARQTISIDGYSLLLLVLLLLYLAEFFAVIPNFFKFTSNDLIDHQAYARMLATSPQYYRKWSYVGYHSLLAVTYLLTGVNAGDLMYSTVMLNFLTALLVYVAFSKLERRKEALLIWGMLTGFGWLAILFHGTDVKGLQAASISSYKSLVWSQPVFFWGLPLTLGIGLLALLLYLDMDESMKGREKIFYVALTTTLAFLVHVAEAIVFVAYLMAKLLFLGGRKESAVGSAAAGAFLTALYLFPPIYSGVGPNTSILLLLGSLMALVLAELRERYLHTTISRLFRFLRSKDREITAFLLAVYLSGLAVWLLHLGEVDVKAIYDLGQVPWFFYPVLLGVTGLLAILSLRYRFPKEFAILALTSILMGRVITYYKLFIAPINYWEYRFPFYAGLGLAVLASIYLRRVVEKARRERVYALLLAVIMLSGYASTAFSIQNWNYMNVYRMSVINDVDFEFATNLTYFDREPGIPALILTAYTYYVSKFAAPRERIKVLPIWLSSGPEVVLYSLSMLSPSDRVAALTTLADISYLEKANASLYSYVRKFMGPIWDTPSLTILNVSSPPIPNAKLAIVLPADTYLRRRALVAYELLRPELPIHTTYLSDDPQAPAGIYIGPSSSRVTVNETLPEDPYDLRWLYIWGNFSKGLKVIGGRDIAITTYELDEGSCNLTICGIKSGYVGIIYGFKNLKNYGIVQYYLDKGFLVPRTVTEGNVTTERPIKIPMKRERCLHLSLQLLNGTVYASVDGRNVEVGKAEKLGVLGFETGNFTGTIQGSVMGTHSLPWNPPVGSTIVSVSGGGELDLTELVDLGLRNLTKAKESFNGLNLTLGPSIDGKKPRKAVYTATDMEASGRVEIEGRPIWFISNGEKKYVNATHVMRLEADKLAFRRGEGFYIDLDLSGIKGLGNVKDAVVRFRTPIRIRVSGNLTLREAHPFVRYVAKTQIIRTDEANASIMMADGSILFDELSYRKAETVSPKYKAFDETKYLLESITLVVITSAAIYLLDRRLGGYTTRKARRRRRG